MPILNLTYFIMDAHTIAAVPSPVWQKQSIPPVAKSLKLDCMTARQTLGNISEEAALQYLSDLFKGNGWIVSLTEAGCRPAILLSDPSHPDTILLIVKFIKQSHKLTYQEARDELIDFENNLSQKYQCSQFAIIALNGVSSLAESLERFNLLLHDWEYISELIRNYSSTNLQEPRIQLFAHNKQTYKKVLRMMKSCTSIAVVQATGTGKSFLIAKLLQDFTGERRLVMAPSIYVLDQVKEHIRWEADKIECMTYARSMNLSQSEIAVLNPKLIVLDEYHRCGAEEWGRGVQNILNAYPHAFKLGTSATPIRYMDNARDMSIELFNNNVAENLSLAQAIVRNILPMPKYVCALYTLTEERNNLRYIINRSSSGAAVKKGMQLELDAATIGWERGHGIPTILKKYLQAHMKKFIVFCKDEQHLLEMEPVVSGWFSEAMNRTNINTYRIHDGEPNSKDNLKAFKSADTKTGIHLLFSINMLNEGLHINEVSGVVLLRPTESPNIFYQQIGRCLKAGLNYSPLIFDLVNNFTSIRTRDFLCDLEFARSQYASERTNEDLEDRCPDFTVIDEVRQITEIFGEIKFRLDSWEAQYQRLAEYKERFGNIKVTDTSREYKSLQNWLFAQRKKMEKNLLEPERRDRLVALGVDMTLQKQDGWQDDIWEQKFDMLDTFRLKYGHCHAIKQNDKEFAGLNRFIHLQRTAAKRGTLKNYRRQKLISIGFEFENNFLEGNWQFQFDALVAYKSEYGHLIVNGKTHSRLADWEKLQRKAFRKNGMDEQRKQKLNSIGFTWNLSFEDLFKENFTNLVDFYRKNDHFRFPASSKMNSFAHKIRKSYAEGLLPADITQQLRNIKFDFCLKETWADARERRLREYEHFFKLNGHGNVTLRNEPCKGLYKWLITQRIKYKKSKLPADIVQRMEAAGVDWYQRKNKKDKVWNMRYQQLVKFKQDTGNVNGGYRGNGNYLPFWCAKQRRDYQENTLAAERVKKLDAIGFTWDVAEAKWEERFTALDSFRKKHGHCLVNTKKAQTSSLGRWCTNTRRFYKEGKLPPEKIKRIESLGFVWDIADNLWHTTYQNLKKYVEEDTWHHLKNQNFNLYNWVNKQRCAHKHKRLPEDKIMLLNMLGINWA